MTELETPEQAETPPRVLIVDDSRIVRVTLAKHLKGRFEIREEGDGEAGWAALEADPEISIVLSDLSMPKLDGYGFLERVRASDEPRIRRLPMVIISGDEDESSRAKAKTLGASDFINKGIGAAELLTRIESLLRLTKACGELETTRGQQVHDPATGLFTRRYIDQQAAQALAHAARHDQPASVMVIGLDNVEALRAKCGDAVLAQLVMRFGKMLSEKVRREDSFGHFDAVNFAIVAPSTVETGMHVFAHRLREAVESVTVGFQGGRLPLSVSIGIAGFPVDQTRDPAALLGLAAQRLSVAADAGGNRVVGSDGSAHGVGAAPSIEHALRLVRAGRGNEIQAFAADLALAVLPLLAFADRVCSLGLPMAAIESRLRERAGKDKKEVAKT